MSRKIAFVISAGRTGTVFLTHVIEQHTGAFCVHEPRGSRSNLVLANFRNLVGPGTPVIRKRFRDRLQRRVDRLPEGTPYIEVNPMLCALTDVLAEQVSPLHVVHLTRHPVGWVRSMRAFKASTKFRHVIDYAPFANPYPVPRPAGWVSASRVEKALWRWRYCNEQLLELAPRCDRYVHARYEDLFHADDAVRLDTLQRILDCVGIEVPPTQAWLAKEPRNPAPPVERVDVDPELVRSICGPLLDRWGYGQG
ncbi:MAG: hypothetical protein R3F61_02830 [Myxococcota bacterium]